MERRWSSLGILVCSLVAVGTWSGCDHTLSGPEPALTGTATPHLVCNEQLTTSVLLSGSGFSPLPVDTALSEPQLLLPTITLQLTRDLSGADATAEAIVVPDDPTAPEDSQVRWLSQTRMAFLVTEGLMLPEGIHAITVTNPNENTTQLGDALAVVPPPELTRIEPMAICIAQGPRMLELFGAGFLEIDDGGMTSRPTVRFRDASGTEVAVYSPTMMGDCSTLPAPATDADSCGSMVIEIPEGDLPDGTYTVVVTNPEPANCSSTAEITVEVVPPPDLTDVTPSRICTGGGTIGLLGEGFRPGATVTAGTLEAGTVVVEAGGMAATASFGLGLDAGTYDVTITNPEGCSDTLTDALEVVEGPIMFFVDPPVVYSGISTQVTIYVSGATGVDAVEIRPMMGGAAIPLMHSFDSARGRILAVVPSGTAAGSYDVVASSAGCDTILPGGLTVTDELTVTIDAIDPAFGHNVTDTSVAIRGAGFESTPRGYLNPATPAPGTVARALQSVAFVDADRLTAVVPSGLPAGVYDLIVVNPTGGVGLLEDAFTVTTDAPPVIELVAPGSVDNDGTQTVTATGSGFATPTATWFCRASDGTLTELTGTVSGASATSADVSLAAASLAAQSVCVLRLTNPDGSYDEFSAVAITEPASNLRQTELASSMTTPRAGLALVTGRATRQARFIHALGGDGGALTSARDTSESASVDPFGDLGSWFAQPNGLPGALTMGGAVTIGRYIYLIGGTNGAAALATTWRAQVLDPADAPEITDIAVRRGMGAGLGAGIWYYRVSAIMPATDPVNPGGETLASDPLVINLPATLPDTLIITLFWTEVSGAESYRIYRSPTPDLASGSELLLATVPATVREFEDDGSVTPSGASPLPVGAHGTWAAMPPLGTARLAHGVGHAIDPVAGDVHYIYALGGRTTTALGSPLASYEVLTVTVAADGSHVVGAAWVPGTTSISVARSELAAYSVDAFAAPGAVPLGTTFIYAVGGVSGAAGMANTTAEGARVLAGGQLTAFSAISDIIPANSTGGFAHMAANGFLYKLGGGPSPVSALPVRAELQTWAGGASPPPNVDNWNSEGFTLRSPRYRTAGAVESAHVFVVGGVDAGGAALATTESTVW